MKTKIGFGLVLMCFSVAALAQRVDIDKERFSVRRTLPPKNPKGLVYQTLSPLSHISPVTRRYVDRETVESQVNVNGYTTVFDNTESVHVDYHLSNFEVVSTDIDKRTVERKNKEGKVTRVDNYYKHVLTYRLNDYYRASLPSGEELYASGSSFSNATRTFTSQEYNTYKAAFDYWRNNEESIKSEIIIEHINRSVQEMNRRLSYEIGFARESFGGMMWIMDSRKHPENDVHQENTVALIEALRSMTFTKVPADLSERVAPALAYFEDLAERDTRDKQVEKLVKSALVNLAEYYYLIDNPLKSISYAQQLIDRAIDKRDGKNLVRRAEALNDLFKINNIFSTHQGRSLSGNTLASGVDLKPKKHLEGMVFTADDEELTGFFQDNFKSRAWLPQKQVNFIPKAYYKGGEYSNSVVLKLKPTDLKGMTIGEKMYLPVKMKQSVALEEPAESEDGVGTYMAEVLMDGKYQLFKFYGLPSDDQQDYTTDDVSVKTLVLETDGETAAPLTTAKLEDILSKHATVFEQYKAGKFSLNGESVETDRSVLQKMTARNYLDENIDYMKLFKTLNGN